MMNLRLRIAERLLAMKQMPRMLKKTCAIFAFLIISYLALNGGALLFASFFHAVIVHVDMPPASQYAAYQTPVSKTAGVEKVVVIPRPTLSHTLDQAVIALRSPASPLIQADAVDAGAYLSSLLHNWLTGILHSATHIPSVNLPQGVPLTQGQ